MFVPRIPHAALALAQTSAWTRGTAEVVALPVRPAAGAVEAACVVPTVGTAGLGAFVVSRVGTVVGGEPFVVRQISSAVMERVVAPITRIANGATAGVYDDGQVAKLGWGSWDSCYSVGSPILGGVRGGASRVAAGCPGSRGFRDSGEASQRESCWLENFSFSIAGCPARLSFARVGKRAARRTSSTPQCLPRFTRP